MSAALAHSAARSCGMCGAQRIDDVGGVGGV